MMGEGFPAQLRLRQRREFLAVQRSGSKYHTRHFLVFVMQTEAEAPPRLGITVTRKVGNAVQRNWIKRRVRDVFRRNRSRFRPGLSMVWIAKKQAKGLSLAAVEADFETLLARDAIRDGDVGEGGFADRGVTKGGQA